MPTFAFSYNQLYTYALGSKLQMLGISSPQHGPNLQGYNQEVSHLRALVLELSWASSLRIDGIEGFEPKGSVRSDLDSSSQISVGALAGIVFGILTITLAVIFAVRRYRQRRDHAAQSSELSKIEENNPVTGLGHKTAVVEDRDSSLVSSKMSLSPSLPPPYSAFSALPRPNVSTTLGEN
ncbi:hypothetical protein BGZ96_010441 [Linnemannia gamsii]|uniref:Uncharacterized protein n=1 Tax=Linnemannia gamsii TaxID=64522 RepID=A0ABQ7JU70_9FUNG|nr:hypothetical protein BGZ96_010441 [Linnemannia gamsii]